MQRFCSESSLAAFAIFRGVTSPSELIIDCVVSIIISIFRSPEFSAESASSTLNSPIRAAACSGISTLGKVTTKFSGSTPPLSLSNVLRKISKVRTPRSTNSRLKGLIRMPMNGGSVPCFIPEATAFAPCTATVSSSSSGRIPNPSS